MTININLLERICKAPGAPGFEQPIRALILKEIKGLVDDVHLDNMGNVYAVKKGTLTELERKKIMIGAHMLSLIHI